MNSIVPLLGGGGVGLLKDYSLFRFSKFYPYHYYYTLFNQYNKFCTANLQSFYVSRNFAGTQQGICNGSEFYNVAVPVF